MAENVRVMMWLILAISAVIIFIENRLALNRQIHIHYLCILLFSLYSVEFCNTLLCAALLYWAFRIAITSGTFHLRPYILSLVIISVILLATGIFSFFAMEDGSLSILGTLSRNFIVMTFWPLILAQTVPDIKRLQKVAYFYAVTRIVEVAVVGLVIYFFFYEEFYLFSNLTELGISIPEPDNPRLCSVGAPNPNDAAFVLLGALCLIIYRLYERFRPGDLLLSLTALAGILFTWTRSVWLFLLIFFLLFVNIKKKLNKRVIILAGAGLIIISVIGVRFFNERSSTDERLQSAYNVDLRKQQMTEYISSIHRLPLFWGLYNDQQVVSDKLNITEEISSENFILEIFTRHGILAGVLVIAFFLFYMINFWLTVKTYIAGRLNDRDDVLFVIAFFAAFVSLFLMAQTSLFRNNLLIWIMIGFMSVIRQNTGVIKNGE